MEWRRRMHWLVLWPWFWWNLQYWDGSWFLGKTAGSGVGCSKVRCLAAISRSRASDRLILREVKVLCWVLWLKFEFWRTWVLIALTSFEWELDWGFEGRLLPNFLGGRLMMGSTALSRIPDLIASLTWMPDAYNCWKVARGCAIKCFLTELWKFLTTI